MIDESEELWFRCLLIQWNSYAGRYAAESEVNRWFRKNHKDLGLSHIEATGSPGDYVATDSEGNRVRVELEGHSSGFWLHDAKIRAEIDWVVCYTAALEHRVLLQSANKKLVVLQPEIGFYVEEISAMYDYYFGVGRSYKRLAAQFPKQIARIW